MTRLHQSRTELTWSRWRTLPRLVRLLWELGSRDMLQVAGFSLVNGLVPVASLFLLQQFVDSAAAMIAGRSSARAVVLWLGGLFAINVVQALFGFWSSLIDDIQERMKARAQERLLVKASRLSLAAFEQPELYDRLQRAKEGLDTRLWPIMGSLLPMPSHIVTVLSLLLYVGSAHWGLPVVLIVGLLPATIVEARTFHRVFFVDRSNTPLRRMQSYLSDLMIDRRAAPEIRLFGLQSFLLERYRQVFFRLRDDRLRLSRERALALVLPGLLEAITAGVVLAWVVVLVIRGVLSVGHLAAYLGAVDRLTGAFGILFNDLAAVDTHLRYIQDIFDYLDTDEERAEASEQEPTDYELLVQPVIPALRHIPTVCFENVTFAYPGATHPVLDGIDLVISPGERIALVGENGAGKSTLARLLLGLYRPTSGHITVDGVEIDQYGRHRWRACVAAVFQDYQRYEVSVRENIGFGDLRRVDDDKAVRAAAAKSGADRVVDSLPAGYATVLGRAYDEQGADLSQGQWQKLAIARAYLRDAGVLVLDEPTAALDARAEVEVYRQFRDVAEGKSVLLISHRLGSARLAHRILVLEEGGIVEQGSHAELVARGGRYAEMYATQSQWYR